VPRPRRPPTTLLEVINARTGSLRKTFKIGTFIAAWAVVRDDLGRKPFVHEYAAWWKVSERTAWREMALFTAAFPEEDGPDRLAELIGSVLPGRPEAAAVLAIAPDVLALA
jgi:hypothetical protein